MTADVIFRTLVCFDFYFIVFIFCLRRVVVVVTECAILRTVFGVDIDGYLVAAHVLNLCNSFAFSLFWSNLDALSPRLNLCTKIIITGVLIIYFVVDLVMYQIKMAPFDEVDCGPGVIGERGGGKKFHCRKMKTLFATTTTTITMLIVQSSKAYIMGYPFAFLRPTYKRQTPLSSGTAGEPMTQESIRPSPQHIKVVPPAESALTVTWWDATVMASPGGTCAPLADDAAKMGEAEEAEEAADALQTAQRRVLELERALQEAKQQHAELAVSIGNSSPAAGDAQEDLSGACSEAAASSAAASSCSLFVPAASASGSGSVVGSGNLSVPPPLEPRSPQRHTTSPS